MSRRRSARPSSRPLRLSQRAWLRMAVRCALGLPLLAHAPLLAAAPPGSPQWVAEQMMLARQPRALTPPPAAGVPVAPGRVWTPQQAQQQLQQSIVNLNRATQAVIAARDAQRIAQQQALGSASALVADGLAPGGLVPAAAAAGDVAAPAACAATFTCAWQNATLPTQTVADGHATVTVTQQARKAILGWDSFNIGANTTLHIDQRAGTQADGGNDWIALNRVSASAEPSRIFGGLRAEGSVYLINPNGVLFGAGSRVDTHSLLASSLPLYLPRTATSLRPGEASEYLAHSNRLFLETGIAEVATDAASGNILGLQSGQNAPLAANRAADGSLYLPGDIRVEAGARIETGALGYTLLAAPNVDNAGSIRADDGQVILAAGVGLALKNAADGGQTLQPVITGRINDPDNGFVDVTPAGQVRNSGLIEAARGDVRLQGANVTHDGVIAVTSSITRPGGVLLQAMDEQALDASRARTGSLQLGAASVTAMLPDANGETTTSSAAADAAFRAGRMTFTGAAVTLAGDGNGQGAFISAPGQDVAITAVAQDDVNIAPRAINDGAIAGRLYIDGGATIDVAGIAGHQLDMADTLVNIPRIGLNELADSPLQRDGILFGAALVIDSRMSGTRADGSRWVGTPIANLSGYVDQVTRDIDTMLVDGGHIDLAGREVIQRAGSQLNLSGGFLHFVNDGSSPAPSRLVTAEGGIVGIAHADPLDTYVGFAGSAADRYSRWNSVTLAANPLGYGERSYETDYVEGGDAGRLRVFGASVSLLEGEILGQALAGRRQVGSGELPQGGEVQFGQGAGSALYNRVFPDTSPVQAARSYRVVEDALGLADIAAGTFDAQTVLPVPAAAVEDPDNWLAWTQVSARKFRDAGFSAFSVVADDAARVDQGGEIRVDAGTRVAVANGGSITLTGSRIAVDGTLEAVSGSISLTATGRTDVTGTTTRPLAGAGPVSGDIRVGSEAVLDASGEWVNDSGLARDAIHGAALVDGGSVTLRTLQSSAAGATPGQRLDITGGIALEAGSRVDVSSGGRVLPSGKLAGGQYTPKGQGGSLALETYAPVGLNFGDLGASALPTLGLPPQNGSLQLDGDIAASGFSGGGTFSLRSAGLRIGGDAGTAQPWEFWLPGEFFAQHGFSRYDLRSEYNAVIADGTVLMPRQVSFLPDEAALRGLATGSELAASGAVSLGQRDDWYRQGVDFSLSAGDYVNWLTNSFGRPDYSAFGINGATVLGRDAAIIADDGARVTLGSQSQVTVLGRIVAHGGDITLTGDTGNGGYAQNPGQISAAYTSDSKSVWLGSEAVLDASGVAQYNTTRPIALRDDGSAVYDGRVLDGGTVTLSNDTGYIVAQSCTDADPACSSGQRATIDVSGVKAPVNLPGADGYRERLLASDAGTVRLGAGKGLFFNGRLRAHAGDETARGGTLLVTPQNARNATSDGSAGAVALEISDRAPALPATSVELLPGVDKERLVGAIDRLDPGEKITGAASTTLSADWKRVIVQAGRLQFSSAVLAGSGIENLRLGSDPLLNTAQVPVPVVFTGDTHLDLARALSINTSVLTATPSQVNTGDTSTIVLENVPVNVQLSANYVSLTGLRYGGEFAPPAAALRFGDDATLAVEARQAMDVGGQLRIDNWADVTLESGGDLRFVTPATYAWLGDPANEARALRTPGYLETTADLDIVAAQVYPATDERFIIKAHPSWQTDAVVVSGVEQVGTPQFLRGTVSFHGQGGAAPDVPWSVGGSLVVDARRIEQHGVLRAPGGQIVLGLGTSAMETSDTYDSDSLALLRYTGISAEGDALMRALTTQSFNTRYTYRDGVLLRTREERATLPFAAVESVRFGAGSETSVAAVDRLLPYGSTADSINLRYNGSAQSQAARASSVADLAGAPGKRITSVGDDIAIEAGANIDLSGGGQLQAQEWIAGTGGSRDVLAQADTWAIVPGHAPALAAYDPALAETPLAGQAVWLSGHADLPAGMYTLLPARYATMPGAWLLRLSQQASDYPVDANSTLPDGSLRVSGRFGDRFSAARDARDSTFLVQRADVWRQYSEYLLTDLGRYFTDPSRVANGAILPSDAGSLSLFAGTQLRLDGEFRTASAGGAGATLAIAAPALQVRDAAGTARDGFLQLDAERLATLDFRRLLLGGVATRENGVDVIKATATAIDVSTTQTALQADELLLVTQGAAGAEGIHVADGSRLLADGAASDAVNLQLGTPRRFDTVTQNWRTAYNGSGALLRLAGTQVDITRINPLDDAAAALHIGESVSLQAGSVTLDSTGALSMAASTTVETVALELAGDRILFSDAPTVPGDGLVIGNALFASLADIGTLALRSRGDIRFAQDTTLTSGQALWLGAASLDTGGHAVSLEAPTLTLAGAAGTATAAQAGTGSLTINAGELRFGAGELRLDGTALLQASASGGITATGKGALNAGAADVTLDTPLLNAGADADFTLATSAGLTLVSTGTTALPSLPDAGGKLALRGGDLLVDTRVQAAGGAIDLRADNNLVLGDAAQVSAAGLVRDFHDLRQAMPGGAVTLGAVNGDVRMQPGAQLDVSAGGNGAPGGRLDIAAAGTVELAGELAGEGGASVRLRSGNAVDLDALADSFLAAGIDGGIDVASASGNLVLSEGHVLRARKVSLSAQGGNGSSDAADGNLTIAGDIDASGEQGGRIELHARGNLLVSGGLDAHGNAADERGGRVVLRTDAGNTGTTAVDATYGHQDIFAAQSGAIRIDGSARIDAGGGASGGHQSGKVQIVAPLLADGDVNVHIDSPALIDGALELEAFATWDTRDGSTGAQHFDGIVDPAGVFTATGTAGVNAGHAAFYTQTLRDFVQAPAFAFRDRFSGRDSFTARAGILLRNADGSINAGDIRVLGDWNLGAGVLGGDGLLALDYRTRGYDAPVLRLSAAHDIVLAASLSDGFFQVSNPFGGSTDNRAAPVASAGNPLPFAMAGLAGYTRDADGNVAAVDSTSFVLDAAHDIRMTGHRQSAANAAGAGSRVSVSPTMLRTGNGDITLAAGHDFVLDSTVAPGVVYAAGRNAPGTAPTAAARAVVVATRGMPAFLDSGMSHPEGGGDVSLTVGNDILGVQRVTDAGGAITGIGNASLNQYWWPWMQRACLVSPTGCSGNPVESSINFAMFGQSLMSIGGDIDIAAAGRIDNFHVSSPVTWKIDNTAGVPVVTTWGGGDLSLFAGTGIGSGSLFVAKGEASVRTLGGIDSRSGDVTGMQIALQDAVIDVVARTGITVDGIHNPSWMFRRFDALGYSAGSALHFTSVLGDVRLGQSLQAAGQGYGEARANSLSLQPAYAWALPATLTAQNWRGDIVVATRGELFPSASGNLELLAGDDLVLYSRRQENNGILGLIDADAGLLPSPRNPVAGTPQASFISNGAASRFDLHLPRALHAQDAVPARFYSLAGSVIDSNPDTGVHGLALHLPKPVAIRAGLDIVNLALSGQHLYASDISTVAAGRDIVNTPLTPGFSVPYIELGGPGVLAVSAGRHLGPLASANDAWLFGYLPRLNPSYPGIRTLGNERNAWLPRGGADIAVDFGTAQGMDLDAFLARYVDPSVPLDSRGLRSNSRTPDYSARLQARVQQHRADTARRAGADEPAMLASAEAWTYFRALPEAQQKVFAGEILLALLNQTGLDYNDPDGLFRGEYLRGYQAIETLFPARLGYTRNALSGVNGAENPVRTGVLDMRGSTLQTRQGGDIALLGPGGDLLVGSASAPPSVPASLLSAGVGPATQGILALESGSVGIFTDTSTLLAQSRIFTLQGGDLLIWSSNGDINAGKGAKTSSEMPPAEFFCDPDRYCVVDAKSQVSGAGIAALQVRPGAAAGTANLVAPAGTVDAGDAGIRSAGALNVAAFQVANADNIQVSGSAIGVPTGVVDTAAASAASAAGNAAAKVAQTATRGSREENGGVIAVRVLDYGDADCGARKEEKGGNCR